MERPRMLLDGISSSGGHDRSPFTVNSYHAVALSGNLSSDKSVSPLDELSVNILFLCMLIFLGGSFFMTYRESFPLPYTVVLFIYGIFVGAVALYVQVEVANALGAIPPDLLFYIFLPVLIFEGSYAINTHALRRVGFQTLILATAGIIINTVLLALVVKLLFSAWSWYTALLLGSLLSATDPVAVVALLKELRVEKKLTALVDGEAVMNDGTAMILFALLLPSASAGHFVGSVGGTILKTVQLSLLPVVLGPAFGLLQFFWLRRAGDNLTKACITVSVTYVSYYIAMHVIGTSGVLTLFFEGTFLSYHYPSLFPGREGNIIYTTWEFLVNLGNTVLFSLVGVIVVADVFPTLRLGDVFIIAVVYVAMLLARLLMFEILLPVLNLFHYKLDQKRVLLLVHSGLRGGVAATLALAVNQEGLEEGVAILKVTSGAVLLTLLINAPTAGYVVRYLGFNAKEQYQVLQMNYALAHVMNTEERVLQSSKRDTKYRNANWMSVERFVFRFRKNPFMGVIVQAENDDVTLNQLLMSAFKTALWRQRDEKVISETVIFRLGSILAEKIERGELFDIREMQLYHRSNRIRRRPAVEQVHTTVAVEAADTAKPTHHSAAAAAVNPTWPASGQGADSATITQPQVTSLASPAQRAGATSTHSNRDGNTDINSHHHHGHSLVAQASGSGGDWGAEDQNGSTDIALNQSSIPAGSVAEERRDGHHPAAVPKTENARVDALMLRLLPMWVTVSERFVFGKGFFSSAHRRAQENAFMTLLAVVKCLTALSAIRFKHVKNEQQARRVERWLSRQLRDTSAAVDFFYDHFPEVTNNVASSRVVLSVANHMEETVNRLHANHGLGSRATGILHDSIERMRKAVPQRWENDTPTKENDLVLQAVAASTLGRGLRKSEVRAISAMGFVRAYNEHDLIVLPENAFLIVVFGSLRALHDSWTVINEHEVVESFGDTVGLDAFLLTAALRKDQQRRWCVVSSAATVLIISFNSIKPFLMERSLHAVKALWRAAAAEVLLPLLEDMVTLSTRESANERGHLMSIVRSGTPLIGPRDVNNFDWDRQFRLCFYLRGSDMAGFFSGHTPPCYVSTFYARQLQWSDPDVVLYAIPVNMSDNGYIPWNRFSGPGTTTTAAAATVPMMMGTSAVPAFATNPAGKDRGREDATAERDDDDAREDHRLGDGGVGLSGSAGGAHYDEEERNLSSRFDMDLPVSFVTVRGDNEEPGVEMSTSPPYPISTTIPFLPTSTDTIDSYSPSSIQHSRTFKIDSYVEATNIVNSVLLGRMPVDLTHPTTRPSAAAANTVHSSCDDMTLSLTQMEPSSHMLRHLRYDEHHVCILQNLSEFVTPVPYMNLLLGEYASMLEQLCIATIRYVTQPKDPLNIAHAQRVAYMSLEFLLSFGLEVSLLRRAVEVISRKHGTSLEALGFTAAGDAVDAALQSRVCAWCRHASLTHRHHLRAIIMEMNAFANCRFKVFVSTLTRVTEWAPELARVETVEGLSQFVSAFLEEEEQQQQ